MATAVNDHSVTEEMSSDLRRKADLLRQHELLCYRIAFAVLQVEEWAWTAALNAYKELIKDKAFFTSTELSQQLIVKKVTMKCALEVYRQAMR